MPPSPLSPATVKQTNKKFKNSQTIETRRISENPSRKKKAALVVVPCLLNLLIRKASLWSERRAGRNGRCCLASANTVSWGRNRKKKETGSVKEKEGAREKEREWYFEKLSGAGNRTGKAPSIISLTVRFCLKFNVIFS